MAETARPNRDHIMIREHDHFRLIFKVASIAEYNNWLKNRSDEDRLTISGLTCLASFLPKKECQSSAKMQIRKVLCGVLKGFKINLRFEVLHLNSPWDASSGFLSQTDKVQIIVSIPNKITLKT